ncbi:hypothetical protein DVQ78_17545, partial [Yersinia enterocolitica]|nr:hypothetical protein [Yersinia enterocolitica]
GTSYQWQIEDTVGSNTYTDIPGATGKTYTPVVTDGDKHLVVKVTPRTEATITDPAVGSPVTSYAARVKALVPLPFTTLEAGGHAFSVTAGFPETAFKGASFTLSAPSLPSGNVWSTDQAGQISLIDQGNGRATVTFITSTHPVSDIYIYNTAKDGSAQYRYRIPRPRLWFQPAAPGDTRMYSYGDVSMLCAGMGAQMPASDDLTTGTSARTLGTLFGEWGQLTSSASYTSVPWVRNIKNDMWVWGQEDDYGVKQVSMYDGHWEHTDAVDDYVQATCVK